MTPPDVSVIIVTHNHAAYLPACLDSLAPERQGVNLEILVVDNASSDGSALVAHDQGEAVRLIVNTTRQGFAANNNCAIRLSAGRYVLILNPDTVTPMGALSQLVRYMDTYPKVGICGPQLRFPDGRVQPSCRRFPTLGSVLARRTPLRKILGRSALNARHLMSDFDHTRTSPVDWMLGACLMVRRELLRTVGLLDEGYFLYVEDIDWCYRAWRAGWQVMYVADTHIVHHHLAESDRVLFSRYSWYHLQSMWRYYRKHLVPRWLGLNVQPDRLP